MFTTRSQDNQRWCSEPVRKGTTIVPTFRRNLLQSSSVGSVGNPEEEGGNETTKDMPHGTSQKTIKENLNIHCSMNLKLQMNDAVPSSKY
jgi:hypothetical protein